LAVGLDQNRLAMLLAVLSRHGGTMLLDQDVFVNVVGGVRIHETAADLAIMLAVLSSYRDRALPEKRIIFGEVGLSGEIRPVPNGQERLKEALKHGFNAAVIPKANQPPQAIKGMTITAVSHLREAIELV
ncbi:MAG TPA: DNA repair protein RadA, partial [Gammaproteobacteria bacterium]|nr:DNA repair protein RadA [Gammaproteobacteria bacterium]